MSPRDRKYRKIAQAQDELSVIQRDPAKMDSPEAKEAYERYIKAVEELDTFDVSNKPTARS